MDKHHVVHIIDGLPFGGAERLLFDIVTRLDTERFSSEVISLYDGPEKVQPFEGLLKEAGIHVERVPKIGKLSIGTYRRLRQYLRSVGPDIVHTHLFAADVWGGLAAQAADVPVIISTEHNINKEEGILKHQLKCASHKNRAAIVGVSAVVQEYVEAYCMNSVGKTRLIRNGIDVERFPWLPPRKHSVPNLLVVGRLDEQKGHAALLHALPLMENDYHLRIVGNGPLRHSLGILVKQLGLSDTVTFAEATTSIQEEYAQADIVVVPSLWEGFGLAAVEAMASGCAVVASRVDGLEELIEHDVHGLLVDMKKPGDVAGAIDKLLVNSDLRAEIATRAHERVSEQFTMTRVINEYEQLYEELYEDSTD